MKHLLNVPLLFLACSIASTAVAQDAELNANSPAAKPQVMTQTKQQNLTPNEVLQRLKEGNKRFMNGNMQHRNLLTKANITASGQFPVAVILNCMDSRTPTELVLDQGIGDIFSIRIAGNIQNNDILGSLEFATQLVGSKLIAVIGHTSCGAVRGACEKAQLGNLTALLEKIQPAVKQAGKEMWGKKDCSSNEFIDQAARNNVILVMDQIQKRSPIIKQLLQEGKIGLVGGMQNLATGEVTFFDDYQIMPQSNKDTNKDTNKKNVSLMTRLYEMLH